CRGLHRQSRALVVVPATLSDAEGIEALVEALEVRFLANQDPHLHFGLLTDFLDAPAQSLPDDEGLGALARMRIEVWSEKYRRAADPAGSAATGDAFYLFHRARRWNPRERQWM